MSEQHTLIDPQQLNDLRQRHLGRLLLRTYRAFSSRAIEKLRLRGYTNLALAHTMLLTNVDVDGTRFTALAEKVGVSRQAIGNLVRNLEQQGYVTRMVDPLDRRAFIVTLTETGWHLLEAVVDVKMEIETEYSAILGAEQMQMLRTKLMRLLDQVETATPGTEISNSG
ncbi:MAG: MarR family transcriptional regulator [Chloroflexi bacterium]|nr:MarR family transcriptional regulator [Chloroflexota bacterium]